MWGRREEISHYVCSAGISAKKASTAIRSHWIVENRNHYVRDVSMMQDANRVRINPGIFARARGFALNACVQTARKMSLTLSGAMVWTSKDCLHTVTSNYLLNSPGLNPLRRSQRFQSFTKSEIQAIPPHCGLSPNGRF